MEQDEQTYIRIPYPDAKDLQLKIVVPKCPLVIAPGIGNVWVTGLYSDPKNVMDLNLVQSGNKAEIIAAGAFAYRAPPAYLPSLKLSFGRLRPFGLTISAGEISDQLDFGGIPLSALEILYGPGSQRIDFSYPNPGVMKLMRINADTGPVQIEGLANANVQKIQLNGDSTFYQLNFGGELKQNTTLRMGVSVAQVELLLPASTAVKIKTGNAPASRLADDFSYADKTYWNASAREQREPLLSIQNAASNLRIRYI